MIRLGCLGESAVLQWNRTTMICPRCGGVHETGVAGDSGSQPLCDACRAGAATGGLTETRSVSPREKAAFLFPERFQPELVLGEGSFGVVYKCWDKLLRRFVAIKRPKSQTVDQELFLREARAASQLNHPGIVQIHDVGAHEGLAYIVSEFVEGVTLKHWLGLNRPSPETSCAILEQVALAIAAAHSAGVIHRDIKPGNILIDPGGRPRIVDFGLSHSRNMGSDTLFVEGRPIGTPAYMAPEQVRGVSEQIDTWSDVYSLGTVLYQMLTGRLPFAGSFHEVLQAIVSQAPLRPCELDGSIPAPLEAICLKAMAKSPAGRYPLASDFARDLRCYREGLPVSAYPRLYPRRVRKLVRRSLLGILAAGSLTALLAGSIWVLHDRQSRDLSVQVGMDSTPAAATLEWIPFDHQAGEFDSARSVRSTAGSWTSLQPGFYRVRATAGGETVEVFRTIPLSAEKAMAFEMWFCGAAVVCPHRWSVAEKDRVRLMPVAVVPEAAVRAGMVWMGNGAVSFPDSGDVMALLKGRTQPVGSFLIDPREVTWRDLEAAFPGMAIPEGTDPLSAANGIRLDVALAWCEKAGKNLPTLAELQYAATNSGTTQFPWGDEPPESRPPGLQHPAVGWDDSLSDPPVQSLLGGVGEWTETVFVARIQPSSGSSGAGSAPGGPVLGGPWLTPFPESWLTVSGDGILWIKSRKGIEPHPPDDKNGRRGFRSARRVFSGR